MVTLDMSVVMVGRVWFRLFFIFFYFLLGMPRIRIFFYLGRLVVV